MNVSLKNISKDDKGMHASAHQPTVRKINSTAIPEIAIALCRPHCLQDCDMFIFAELTMTGKSNSILVWQNSHNKLKIPWAPLAPSLLKLYPRSSIMGPVAVSSDASSSRSPPWQAHENSAVDVTLSRTWLTLHKYAKVQKMPAVFVVSEGPV